MRLPEQPRFYPHQRVPQSIMRTSPLHKAFNYVLLCVLGPDKSMTAELELQRQPRRGDSVLCPLRSSPQGFGERLHCLSSTPSTCQAGPPSFDLRLPFLHTFGRVIVEPPHGISCLPSRMCNSILPHARQDWPNDVSASRVRPCREMIL